MANMVALEVNNVYDCDSVPDGYWAGGGYGASFTSNYFASEDNGAYTPAWGQFSTGFASPGCAFSVSGSGTSGL
jgi:hypothetical protein